MATKTYNDGAVPNCFFSLVQY